MNDLKALAQQISDKFNAEYRENVSYVAKTDTIAKVSVTNWLEMPKDIQEAIGLPGLPIGNITCVYGKPNAGKTTFLMQGIVAAQQQNILPILILTEHKFDFSRISKFMGGDPEAMVVIHAESLEKGYSFLEKTLRDVKDGLYKDQKVFVFWDSIGNTMSDSELEYEIEDHGKSMGKGAKAIKTLTRRVNQLLGRVRQQVGILFLNQSYMSMPSYGPSVEVPFGGDGIPYSSALIIRLKRVKDLKMTLDKKETIVGLETKVEVKKNHITHNQAISTVYTVASGMIAPTKEALEDFKKQLKSGSNNETPTTSRKRTRSASET